jgi:hypothetical protein
VSEPPPNVREPFSRPASGDRLVAAGLFMATLLAYVRTAAPGIVAEGDCSEYVAAARCAGIPHAPGYPTYMLLASLVGLVVPAESLARALNLTSAFFGALTVALVVLVVARLARRTFPLASATCARGAAALAGVLLAVSTEFWNQSLGAEVYTLSTALLALCLERLSGSHALRPGSASLRGPGGRPGPELLVRSVSTVALAAGLAFGVHYNAGVPCALLVGAKVWRARSALGARGIGRAAAFFLLGLATFLYLPLRSLADPALDFGDPETPGRFARMLTLADMPTGKAIGRELGVLLQQTAAVAGLSARQWPAWVFTLFGLGAMSLAGRGLPRRAGFALAAIVVLDYAGILAMSNFELADEQVYELRFLFLPVYLVLAVVGGLGFAFVAARAERSVRVLVPLGLLLLAAAIAPWALAQARRLDKSEDHVMREYGLALFAAAEEPAVLFAYGDNAWMPLAYLQTVEGARPDVTLVAAGLLRHEWYRRQLRARFTELELSEAAPGVAGIARANLARASVYHADPRTRDVQGFQEIPSGLLMRLVPAGERALPAIPPAFPLSPGYAVLDMRERSIRADMVQAYARTSRWCRASGHLARAEEACAEGLALTVPVPRLAEFHLARADLLVERGDLRAVLGRLEEARADWQLAVEESDPSPPATIARQRLAAFAAGVPK